MSVSLNGLKTSALSQILTANLTSDRVLLSDAAGKIIVSTVSSSALTNAGGPKVFYSYSQAYAATGTANSFFTITLNIPITAANIPTIDYGTNMFYHAFRIIIAYQHANPGQPSPGYAVSGDISIYRDVANNKFVTITMIPSTGGSSVQYSISSTFNDGTLTNTFFYVFASKNNYGTNVIDTPRLFLTSMSNIRITANCYRPNADYGGTFFLQIVG